MAVSSAVLIEKLVKDIALSGPQGFSARRFVDTVRTFYDEHNLKATAEQASGQRSNILFSDAPPIDHINVNDGFLENVLSELRNHPDVQVRPTKGENVPAEQAKNDVPPFPKLEAQLAGRSLFVSEERLWQEITGHSVDHSRIPSREFDCLVVIAAAGSDGLLQKHVTERTGQDKRSVPKRTDRLARNGYIIKEAVVGGGARTSNLRLKKFCQLPTAPVPGDEHHTTEQSNDNRSIIFYDVWFDTTVKMLQDNKGTASLSDLRVGLNIDGKQWETRRYFHCLRRLISAGMLRTLSAVVSGGANDVEAKAKRNIHKKHSLQLLREPTAADRKAFQTGNYKNNRKVIIPDHDKELGQSDGDEDALLIDANEGETGAGEEIEGNKPPAALIARWTPLTSLHNQIFELVDIAGPEGLTAKQLYEQLSGASWHRPVDEALAKLTDAWQHSQPPHLRHLTLTRDTTVDAKAVVYHFRSLDNFVKAVAAGQAAWEAVFEDDARVEFEKAGKTATDSLDQWGFPLLDKRCFVRGGRASLTECGTGLRSSLAGVKGRRNDAKAGMEDDASIVSEPDLPPSTRPTPQSAIRKVVATVTIGTRPDGAPSALLKLSTAGAANDSLKHLLGSFAHGNQSSVHGSTVADPEVQEPASPAKETPPECDTSHMPESEGANAEDSAPPRKRRRIVRDEDDDVEATPATISTSSTPPPETHAARRLREHFATRRKGRPNRAFLDEAERLRNLVAEEEKERQNLKTIEAPRRELEGSPKVDMKLLLGSQLLEQRQLLQLHDSRTTPRETSGKHGEARPMDITTETITYGAQGPEVIENDVIDGDAPEQSRLEDADAEPDAMPTKRKRPSRVKRAGLNRDGGSPAAQREKIVLDAVHACGGVFPGNNEMWYVVATAWQKRSSQTIDRQTLHRAIRNIIANGKLQKITWTFSDKKGFVQTRAILAEPHIMPQEPIVKAMQRRIEECLPNQYLPKEVEVFTSLRHQASNAPGTTKPGPVSRAKESHVAGSNTHDHGLEHVIKMNRCISGHVRFPVDDIVTVQSLSNTKRKPLTAISANDQVDTAADKFQAMQPASRATSSTVTKPLDKATPDSVIDPVINGSNASITNDAVIDTASLAARFQRSQKQYQNIPSGRNVLPVPVKRKYRKRHNKNAIHPLSEGGEQWLQARALFMGLACFAHATTGTFASRAVVLETGIIPHRVGLQPMVVEPPGPPSKSLRKLVDEIGPSGQPRRSKRLSHEEQDAFHRDVDTVRRWEEQMIAADKPVRREDGVEFVNFILKVPHVVLKRASQKRRVEITALIPDEAEAAPDETEPAPRKKYRSRKAMIAPTLEVEDEEVPPRKSRVTGDKRKKRDRRGAANFADGERLIAAIALVTVVCGGVNQDRLNWTLIAHALSFRYDGEFLRRRWNWNGRGRRGELEDLRDAIREPFLIAYEKGEIPRVDYQNLDTTDWPALLEWVEYEVMPTIRDRPNVDPKVEVQPVSIAPSQAFFEASSGLRGVGSRKNEYFENLVMEQRKLMALHFFNGTLLPAEDSMSQDETDHVLLKSWIRAVALTKQWNYNADAASTRLSIFDEATLSQVTQEMIESHILLQDRKGRHLPGRNYQIHQDVLSQFRRWTRHDEHLYLRAVADARTAIDEHFEMNDHLELVATAQDVEYLILINMAAQGLITLKIKLPERNDDPAAPHPKLTKWSYGGNNYETKNTNINDLKFPLFFEKTANYTSDHGLQSAPIPTSPTVIFPGEPSIRLPIWIDIHGNRLDDVWDMVVRSTLYILVYRSGFTSAMIEAAHESKLWTWEIDLILTWMEAAGVAEHCGAADEDEEMLDAVTGAWGGGWRATAWWYCAFLPEVADWPAPGGREIEQHAGLQLGTMDGDTV